MGKEIRKREIERHETFQTFQSRILPKHGRPNCQGNQSASAVKTVRELAIHGENSRLGIVSIGRKSQTSICRRKVYNY